MKFLPINIKIQFYKLDSFNAEGWNPEYCETMYKIFYNQRNSFIYNLKDGKYTTYFSFTDFDPFIISKKDNSIFLFKREDNMSKKKETLLSRYNLENSELEDTYELFQHFKGIDNFEFIKIEYINDVELAILVRNYDSNFNMFSIIILNIKTKKSILVEIDKDMIIDTYQKNTLFIFEGELYIPYIIKENKRRLFAFLYRRNDILKEQGILKYKNGRLEKVKSLDTEYTYNIFSDHCEKYLACIKSINREYQVNVYYHNKCILKQKYILGKKEGISFKFSYNKNNDALFVVALKQKYEIFNLVNRTIIYIGLTEEEMKRAYLLSNDIILFEEPLYDVYSTKRIVNLYEFKF